VATFALYAIGILSLLYGLVGAVYWFIQERFVFVRFRLPPAYTFTFAQPFDEVYIRPEKDVLLHALHFTVPEPRGTVLYFHGNTGSLRRWGKRAAVFTKLGYAVLMVDYRGYGKSSGRLSEAAMHGDATRWYQWLMEREQEERIVVYGRSLGSGFAVPVAAAHHPRMLILESPFANLYDPARHQVPFLPYRWLLRYPFRSDRAIRRIACPVYIFHGQRDPVVPYKSALRLYSLIPSSVKREMITFNKGYHSDLGTFKRFHRKLAVLLGSPVAKGSAGAGP
jgi:fermentation-respiration switch protein FrsA (DUF1100 family)